PSMGLESAVAQESWPRMSVMHDIFASVPERWIQDDGRSVSFRGSSRTFLPGVATVRAVGDPYVDGPYPCDGGSVSAVSVDGMLTGVPGHPLTARFDTGEVSAPLPPDAWYGGIGRLVVT